MQLEKAPPLLRVSVSDCPCYTLYLLRVDPVVLMPYRELAILIYLLTSLLWCDRVGTRISNPVCQTLPAVSIPLQIVDLKSGRSSTFSSCSASVALEILVRVTAV